MLPDESTRETLGAALSDKSSHIVARAATIAAELDVSLLADQMAQKLLALIPLPYKSDPTCAAKIALAEALVQLRYQDETPFLEGIRHIQLEPVFGGKEDTAGSLRASCALGLVQASHPDAMTLLADLLADPEADARIGAVKAFAASGETAALPLLRYKAQVGDKSPAVMHASFVALLQLDWNGSQVLIERLLFGEDDVVAEAAIIALGESQRADAVQILTSFWEKSMHLQRKQTALSALALLRFEESLDFLFELLAYAPKQYAQDAIQALRILDADPDIRDRIREVSDGRPDLELGKYSRKTN